jgi:hypothetical protein
VRRAVVTFDRATSTTRDRVRAALGGEYLLVGGGAAAVAHEPDAVGGR